MLPKSGTGSGSERILPPILMDHAADREARSESLAKTVGPTKTPVSITFDNENLSKLARYLSSLPMKRPSETRAEIAVESSALVSRTVTHCHAIRRARHLRLP